MDDGPSAERRGRILLVDDEEDILITTAALLRRRLTNVDVETVPSGPDALDRLEAGEYDLVITDYRMPRMNGLELLAAAAEVAPRTRRILMTAYPDMHLAMEALNQQRISYFLIKPLDPQEFPQQVAECILAARRDQARDSLAQSAVEMATRWQARRTPGPPEAAAGTAHGADVPR